MPVPTEALRILLHIGKQGPLARHQIARDLAFTPSRVTRLTEGLIQAGLLEETPDTQTTPSPAPGKRRGVPLELREGACVLAGLRISFSSAVHLVLMDLRANLLEEERFLADKHDTPSTLATRVTEAFEACLTRRPELRGRCMGLGVGISGLVNPADGLIHSSPGFPAWRDIPLATLLNERLELPCFLENDVTMSTLAELWYGAGRGCDNFLFFNLGPGLRMGIVIDGAVYRGATGNAGEVGHITHDEKGPLCHCGSPGCLELYVSNERALDDARDALRRNAGSLLVELCGGRPENLELRHIFRAAAENDRLARTLLERLCGPLGQTVANLVNIFDTRLLLFGGALAEAGDALLNELRRQIDRHTLPYVSRGLRLELAHYDARGTAIGGGALVLEKICAGEIPV